MAVTKIQIEGIELKLSEELLNHYEVSMALVRFDGDNVAAFKQDFSKGAFNDIRGYVAYQKTVPCGLGDNQFSLYRDACRYYGDSSLVVFPIPEDKSGLALSVKNAMGRLHGFSNRINVDR